MNTAVRTFIDQAGGPDEIRRLLLLFYQRMAEDTMIGFFFAGKDLVSTAQRQAEFILAAGGYLDRFEGKGPATAHTHLPPILEGHFDRRLVILRQTLTEGGLSHDAIAAWITFEEGFRKIVVSSGTQK